jgi:hypothetical protein
MDVVGQAYAIPPADVVMTLLPRNNHQATTKDTQRIHKDLSKQPRKKQNCMRLALMLSILRILQTIPKHTQSKPSPECIKDVSRIYKEETGQDTKNPARLYCVCFLYSLLNESCFLLKCCLAMAHDVALLAFPIVKASRPRYERYKSRERCQHIKRPGKQNAPQIASIYVLKYYFAATIAGMAVAQMPNVKE